MTVLADERLDEERLRQVLASALGCASYRIVVENRQCLKPGVYRMQLRVAGSPRSVIAKRLAPEIAVRNQKVVERWLPAEGLQATGPLHFGFIPMPGSTWLVSEDLGPRTLQVDNPDPAHIEAAVELVARLHRRYVDHPLLGECRMWGGDVGMGFHAGNLRDALRALAALRGRLGPEAGEHAHLCQRLHARLQALQADCARRTEAMERWGGPETLLHGDLWPTNFVEVSRGTGFEFRLIDWDRAAVGPPLYDVSTFLYRVAPEERRRVWAAYRRAFGAGSWSFPEEPELALLCETAEHARMANRVIWPAIAALRGEAWGLEELTAVAGWFEDLQPLLP